MAVCTSEQRRLWPGSIIADDRKGDHHAFNTRHRPHRAVAARGCHVLHARRLHSHPPGGGDYLRAAPRHSGPESARRVITSERPVASLHPYSKRSSMRSTMSRYLSLALCFVLGSAALE